MAISSVVGQRKGIQSIEVGVAVLEYIERAGGPIALSRIAQSCGMTPSRAHFYLVSLSRVGLVSQDTLGGLYRLGPAALRLGLSALAQCDVLELARNEMARLSALTGDTVFLSVWGHNGATVISRFDGVNVAPLAVRVGAVMPLAPSATGRVFLAWMPRGHTSGVLRRENTQAPSRARLDRAQIDRLVETVKRNGIALTPGAVAAEMIAIAAPVFDHTQQLQCVLTVTERAQQLDAAGRQTIAEALRQSAEAVSRAAGYGIGRKLPPRR